MPVTAAIQEKTGRYRQRDTQSSPLYQVVKDHFDSLKQAWPTRFEEKYGPWQSHWDTVVENYIKCGDLHFGFGRLYCPTCQHHYLRPFSCDSRNFCPSCEARRRVVWVCHVVDEVLPEQVPYRMLVFTMPVALRSLFMRDHALLGEFSRIAYRCTRVFFQAQFPDIKGVPYFVSSIQTWGDQANIHPHEHCLVSWGIRDGNNCFHMLPEDLDLSSLVEVFRRGVFSMLLDKKRIKEETVKKFLSWRHTGFSVDGSVRVGAEDREALTRVAAYVLKPPVSLKRLSYVPGSKTLVYRGSRNNPATGRNFTVYDCQEFLALLLLHVPHRYECRIYYYGAAASTERRKGEANEPELLEEEESGFVKKRRKSWGQLIHRIFGVDPMQCPKCGSQMKVIALIQDAEVIEKILRHLKLWDGGRHDLFGRGGVRDPPDGKGCLEVLFDDVESVGDQAKMRGDSIKKAIRKSWDQDADTETDTRLDKAFFDDLPPEER